MNDKCLTYIWKELQHQNFYDKKYITDYDQFKLMADTKTILFPLYNDFIIKKTIEYHLTHDKNGNPNKPITYLKIDY